MIRKVILGIAGAGAVAFAGHGAFAQSVTYAPPPSENLSRLQERVGELERMLQQSTSENERLAIELRRARNENERLQRVLAESQTPVAPAAPPSPLPGQPPGMTVSGAAQLDAAELLREGMRYLQQSRFAEAEASFSAYVQANPQSPDTPEARYFIGRTQYAQRRFTDAADTLIKFLGDYPNGARAPDAWVTLGLAFKGLDKIEQACGVFRDLPTKYPRASTAARNLASTEARAANCR